VSGRTFKPVHHS